MVRIVWILLLVFSIPSFGQTFRAGVAVKNITPKPLLPISGGVGVPKEAHTQKGNLYARALVLAYGTTTVALVSVDNLGWPAVLGDKARAKVPSIFSQNIIIAATHTHSAPDAYAFPDEKGKSYADLKYLDWCTEQIAAAINEAYQALEEVSMKVGYGKVAKGIAYNYYAPDLYDPNCGVLQFLKKKDGAALATLVNFAIHPEVLGSKQGILSPDLCGPLYDHIEEQGGGTAIFFNGALGGMVTADTRRPNSQEDNRWEECIRIGNLLGSEALRLLKDAPVLQSPNLAVRSHKVSFPVESDIMKYILKYSPMGYSLDSSGKISTTQNLVNIGPARLVTIPGEALPNIGYYLKRKMDSKFPFLLGLANDAFGYILSKEDFDSFDRYQYITKTSLGSETGEVLINETLKLLKENE